MNENITKRNDLLSQKVIKGLESRNMKGYYAHSKEEALKMALDMIPEGSSVTMGGSMSAQEIGLVQALKDGNYNFIDRNAYEDKRAAMLAAYDADVFLSSVNAMTSDGILKAHFQVSFATAMLSALLLTVLGVLAGLAPSLRAMNIKPVDAMRDE